ncbi:Fluoroacetyl-CoA thioesterase [Sporotomaculum syntrophicum]|uniref:Fluoroacetyl-CoA thioesterase n=1 Tax=Sporotomaculum syntrophicum TaxID=182264 RepID=A0A9D3AYT6_9FIRM|nr:thioesterase family protein [Sporotomaculum syntrophicum]KAF1085811.1 Fluoroacetyl-CoA thioesterase [Sporotomaculum syntrophicum]
MFLTDNIKPGLVGIAQVEVNEQNTAIAYGSGGIKVYATPAMIGLMEKAALSSVDPLLPEGYSTVGIKVNVEHVAATPIGGNVRAHSKLMEIDGRRLVFDVQAYDDIRLVGQGIHERFIVQSDQFLQRVTKQK